MELDVTTNPAAASKGAGDSGGSPRATLILSRSNVEGLVTMAEVIAAVETAHADISSGTAAQPSPAALSLASSSASFLAMAALADRQGLAAVKLLADIPDNAARHLPVQRSVLVLVSQETGASASDHPRADPDPPQDSGGERRRHAASRPARQPRARPDRRRRPRRRARPRASGSETNRARARVVADRRPPSPASSIGSAATCRGSRWKACLAARGRRERPTSFAR